MGASHLMQKVGQLKIISAQVSKQKILMYKSAERKKSQMNLEEMLLYCHAAA
jgi:hypothetical protein